MDPMPWISVRWRGRSSGAIGEASGGSSKKISGKRTSGWRCLLTSGDNNKTALYLTISTVSRTIPTPFATHAIRRAIFLHPSAQREKEKGEMARAKERAKKDFKERATANFSPKEDGI